MADREGPVLPPNPNPNQNCNQNPNQNPDQVHIKIYLQIRISHPLSILLCQIPHSTRNTTKATIKSVPF